jgi:hypothetical protein
MAAKTPQETSDAPSGSKALFDRYLAEAMKIPAAEVRPAHGDLSLAVSNAVVGVSAVLGFKDRFAKELPLVSLQSVESLAELGQAAQYAAGHVGLQVATLNKKDLLAKGLKLRKLLLSSADTLVEAGIFQADALKEAHQAHGGEKLGRACIALAALFEDNAAAVAGKTPVTQEQLHEADAVGAQLLAVLTPKGGKKPAPSQATQQATDARDRLVTLFENTWEDHVWRAGAWFFKRQVAEKVPLLHARAVVKHKAKKDPAP